MSEDLDAPSTPMRQESFKLTDAESSDLKTLARGQSRGALLRQWIRQAKEKFPLTLLPLTRKTQPRRLHKPAPDPLRPPADPELIRQLARLGNLLNQIAKGLHICRHQGQAADLAFIHFLLLMIDGHFEHLRESYTFAPKATDVDTTGGEPP